MIIIKSIICLLPGFLKRRVLVWFFKYDIHPSAHIGLSWIFPKKLKMEEGSFIGHFNVAIHLDKVLLEKKARIGRGNWITGLSTHAKSDFFLHQPDREAALLLREASAITKNHHIDCTNRIEIGAFSIVGGYQSQLLTHSVDIYESRQDSAPITVGKYSFLGTNVVLLGGAALPDYSVLGAKSMLNKSFSESYYLYAGVPAKAIQELPKEAKYFNRKTGYIH